MNDSYSDCNISMNTDELAMAKAAELAFAIVSHGLEGSDFTPLAEEYLANYFTYMNNQFEEDSENVEETD